MTGFCKTHVPKDVEEALESIKDNDEAVKNFGIDLGTRMCKRILDSGTPGLHMYTLNTERSSVAILENLGLINKSQVGHLLAWTYSCRLCRRRFAHDCSELLQCTECSTMTRLWKDPHCCCCIHSLRCRRCHSPRTISGRCCVS